MPFIIRVELFIITKEFWNVSKISLTNIFVSSNILQTGL